MDTMALVSNDEKKEMDCESIEEYRMSLVTSEQKKEMERERIDEYIRKIHYSERYSDDEYEYRHVILPKPLLKHVPKNFFKEKDGPLRILSEDEWRSIGIMQSLGWEHYEVHAPEPHVLLFRRPHDFEPPVQLPPSRTQVVELRGRKK